MANEHGLPANDTNIPLWIEPSLFEPVFKEIVPDFKQTRNFEVKRALSAGENYATIMLRLEAEVELKDSSSKIITLMLKTAHDNEMFRQMMKSHNVFEAEAIVYQEVVPVFEQLYKNVGMEVKFGAKSFQIATDQPYILLEDLKPNGFINVNRLEGMDMDHTHSVLKKLAQWHAASAVHVAVKGPFNQCISESFFKEETCEMMRSMFAGLAAIQLHCMKSYDGHGLYYERVCEKSNLRLDELFDATKVDKSEFNVLNHGDCWSNNVMFQHDESGKITETYLVDYQVTRYGSPAQDLYYFLLSSTNYELKIKNFDYFIKYYYNELTEHLRLLSYAEMFPTLKDLHIMLHKYNAWGLATVNGVMAAVLLKPNDEANLDNFIGDDDVGVKLKIQMYSNSLYRKHAEMILPWLYNRGAI